MMSRSDLPGPFEDVRDAPVAQPLLDQVVATRAHGAQQLDAPLGHRAGHLTAFGLGDRRFYVVLLSRIREPSSTQDGERRRLRVRLHLHQTGFRPAACASAALPIDAHALSGKRVVSEIKARAGLADPARGHARPRHVERLHDTPKAAGALLRDRFVASEQVVERDTTLGEGQRGRVARADAKLLFFARDLEARRALHHDERFDACSTPLRIDGRPYDDALRPDTCGHEDLFTVEHPAFPVAPRRRRDGLGVGPAARLRDGHRQHGLPPAILLLGCPGGKQGGVAQPRERPAQHDRIAPGACDGHEHLERRGGSVVRRSIQDPLKRRGKHGGFRQCVRRDLLFVVVVVARVLAHDQSLLANLLEDFEIVRREAEVDHHGVLSRSFRRPRGPRAR